jgi:hypothetical protein
MVVPVIPRMQELFRDWHALDQTPYEGVSVLSKQLEPYIGDRRRSAFPAVTTSCSSERAKGSDPSGSRRVDLPQGGEEPA